MGNEFGELAHLERHRLVVRIPDVSALLSQVYTEAEGRGILYELEWGDGDDEDGEVQGVGIDGQVDEAPGCEPQTQGAGDAALCGGMSLGGAQQMVRSRMIVGRYCYAGSGPHCAWAVRERGLRSRPA